MRGGSAPRVDPMSSRVPVAAPEPSSLRSIPALNAGSAPVRIITSTASSASSSVMAFGSRLRTSRFSALRASGRLIVIVATPSSTSTNTTSLMANPSLGSGDPRRPSTGGIAEQVDQRSRVSGTNAGQERRNMTDLIDASLRTSELSGVKVRPLSGHTGAQIQGIDIAAPLTTAERDLITDALQPVEGRLLPRPAPRPPRAGRVRPPVRRADLRPPLRRRPAGGLPEIYTVDPERFAAQYGIEGEAAVRLRKTLLVHERLAHRRDRGREPARRIGAARRRRARVRRRHHLHQPGRRVRRACPSRCSASSTGCGPSTGTARRRRGNGATLGGNDITEKKPLVARHPVVRVHPITGERGAVREPRLHLPDRRREARREPGAARPPVRRDHARRSTPSASTGSRAASRSGTTASPPTSVRRTSTTSTCPVPCTA